MSDDQVQRVAVTMKDQSRQDADNLTALLICSLGLAVAYLLGRTSRWALTRVVLHQSPPATVWTRWATCRSPYRPRRGASYCLNLGRLRRSRLGLTTRGRQSRPHFGAWPGMGGWFMLSVPRV